jgi:uncharacterized protein (TIGR00288 family)
MSTENAQTDVAVFIDFENVYVSVREKLDASPNFESIMDRCSDLGRVVIARAYADWYRYPRITSALYANGIEPMYVPTYYYDKEMGRTGRAIKNSVDMNLCIDVMKTLYQNHNIAKFVLATGDRDFIPLVNSVRQQGKEVIIIGVGGAASTHLAQSADEFIFYEQLVGKAPQPSITRKGKGASRSGSPLQDSTIQRPEPAGEPDIYDTLVEAVHVVRDRGYLSTLGSLKLVMKELMGGEFKESRYKDLNGRSFNKFKDFVVDAEKRGKIQIYTNGTVSEVFLPGEDASKLSQFSDFKEESPGEEPLTPNGNGSEEPTKSASTSGSSSKTRRRRRPRNQRQDSPKDRAGTTGSSNLNKTHLLAAEKELLLSEAAREEEERQKAEAMFLEERKSQDPDIAHLTESDVEEFFGTGAGKLEDYSSQESSETGEFPFLQDEQSLLFNVGEALTLSQMIDFLYDESGKIPPASAEHALAEQPQTDPKETKSVQSVEHTQQDIPHEDTDTIIILKSDDTSGQQAGQDSPSLPPAVAVPSDTSATTEASPSDTPLELEEPEEEMVNFSDEEWQTFRTMMGQFTKPVSFATIFDSLRNLRKEQLLMRTNEHLRNLVKQAINNGTLERTGRGKRVYYTLKQEEQGAEEPQEESPQDSDPAQEPRADEATEPTADD